MQTGLEAAKNPDSQIHAALFPPHPALGKEQPKQGAAAARTRR